MPIRYEIDVEQSLIRTYASGVLTDDDIAEHKERLVADPQYRTGMSEISDLSGIERLEISPEGVERFVSLDKTTGAAADALRLALVAPHDAVFGMARMYQTRTQETGANVRVFRTIEEAEAWLDVRAS